MNRPGAETFDFIIVGAGSAGCVLANRLSARPNATVLLLEAGGRDRHPYIHIPAAFIKTFTDPRFNWCFETEPVPGAGNRSIFFPRGKVLGGSSSISGHLYVRGQAEDYDTWAALGNRGWSYADVLPLFKAQEDRSAGADAYHGSGGPQHVSDIHERHPLCEAFIEGAVGLGLPRNPDYNGADQAGTGYYQRMIRAGRRHSAAVGFLHPVLERANLTLKTRAQVTRLECAGRQVTGVSYHQDGRTRQAVARREVLLCGGAIASPQLLQVSGIGPGALLQKLGIPVVHESPGVGEGLQDHYAVRVSRRVNRPITLNHRARGWRLCWEAIRWYTSGSGLLAFSPAHAFAFARSDPGLARPDLQLVFTPASYADSTEPVSRLQDEPGMTCGVWQTVPTSFGHVHARSADTRDAPAIQPNYLDTEHDRKVIVQGLKWCRRLLQTEALAPDRGPELSPGTACESDDDLLTYAASMGSTVYHPVSTCRMGRDALAVVDPELKLHGMTGLRVVDASVMPTMVSANTNAATLMIAEKAAQLITGG